MAADSPALSLDDFQPVVSTGCRGWIPPGSSIPVPVVVSLLSLLSLSFGRHCLSVVCESVGLGGPSPEMRLGERHYSRVGASQ